MINVTEAKKIIHQHTSTLAAQTVNLYDATGMVMAEDLYSKIDMPPFNQSAMDGYAFKFSEWQAGQALNIVGEIPAGFVFEASHAIGSAVRIYTGAQVPAAYDTIVMQEKVRVENKQLFIDDPQIKVGLNLRPRGSQTEVGDLAIKNGTVIIPGVAGFLAGLGFHEVKVFPKPKIVIINTGNELMKAGENLLAGKIYESNSYSLNAALNALKIKASQILWANDDEKEITELIEKNLNACDVLILSGGVSVGDYDYVDKALNHSGVKCLFHKVKQKPGKPFYFGKKDNTLIFALPGNPAAVLTCFYEYIAPALLQLMGQVSHQTKLKLALAAPYHKKPGLTHFLKGKIMGNEVIPLNGQESYLMNSFVIADCLIQLEEDGSDYAKGDQVEVHPIKF